MAGPDRRCRGHDLTLGPGDAPPWMLNQCELVNKGNDANRISVDIRFLRVEEITAGSESSPSATRTHG